MNRISVAMSRIGNGIAIVLALLTTALVVAGAALYFTWIARPSDAVAHGTTEREGRP